jgi:hypothetical protein
MQVLVAPVKNDLEDVVELSQGGVTADKNAAPDQWAGPAQNHTELIAAERYGRRTHDPSMAQCPSDLKAPGNLTLAILDSSI